MHHAEIIMLLLVLLLLLLLSFKEEVKLTLQYFILEVFFFRKCSLRELEHLAQGENCRSQGFNLKRTHQHRNSKEFHNIIDFQSTEYAHLIAWL